MNIEHPSSSSSPRRRATLFSTNTGASSALVTLISDLIAAVESGGFDLHNATLMDSMPLFRVCLNNNVCQDRSIPYSDPKEKL